MKVPLCRRLQACCNYIVKGDRVADVGTDHGYLGIWLLQQGIASSVIASDIVPGPLRAAKTNAARFGFTGQMEFCLSDGVQNIPRDFSVLVCAGMGAHTMVSILSAAPWLQSRKYRLVLQCQNKTHLLRRYLSENGWRITAESIVKDGRFLYTVMEAIWGEPCPLTPGQCFLSPAMLKNPSPHLPEYYRRTTATLRKIVAGRGEQETDFLSAALREMETFPIQEVQNGNC